MNILRIAKALIKASDPEYIYDPDHKKRPHGDYHKTEKGWSKKKKKEKEKESNSSTESNISDSITDNQIKVLENIAKKGNHFYPADGTEESETIWDIVENKNLPTEVIQTIANNFPEFVTEAMELPNNDDNTLYTWVSNTNDFYTNSYALMHKNIGVKTLTYLVNNGVDEEIRMEAKERLKELLDGMAIDEIRKETKKGGNEYTIASSSSSPAVLIFLGRVNDGTVRETVAQNPNTPKSTIELLATDNEWAVRSGVTQNPNTSLATLVSLVKDSNKFVSGDATEAINKRVSEIRKSKEYKLMEEAQAFSNSNDFYSEYIAYASYFGDKKAVSELKKLEKQHYEAGHLTAIISRGRMPIKNRLDEMIRNTPALADAQYLVRSEAAGSKLIPAKPFVFDRSKLSPEMRERVKDWSDEDIRKFIGWLKKRMQEKGDI